MKKRLVGFVAAAFFAVTALMAMEAVHTLHGTVSRVDAAAKTILVKTADGAEHVLPFTGKAADHGAKDAAKESWRGLREGSEVIAHYTVKGTDETALEIGKVGKDGLKEMDGAVTHVDKAAKTVTVKSADGTEHVLRATDHALADLGGDTAKAATKTGKVTVYYTEAGGRKVAHFFKSL